MAPHPRYKANESVEAALAAIDELNGDILQALGKRGVSLLSTIAINAPGTLFHSLRVLDMLRASGYANTPDEAAAVLIHDCGKLIMPAAFAENGGDKRPEGWVLSGHVDHGVMIAKDIEAPPIQLSAIEEHHGTSPIDDNRRYQGKAPQTMFTAVLMMADTLEAITAAHGRERANQLLMGICEQRIQDHQFDSVGADAIRDATQRLISGEGAKQETSQPSHSL